VTDNEGSFSVDVKVTGEKVTVGAKAYAPAETVTMKVPTTWAESSRPQNMLVVADNQISEDLTVTVAQAPKLATSQKKSQNLPKTGDASMTFGSGVLALSGIALLGLYHRIKE
jgi:LPXTG-motif cell wall-anchored protein